MEKQKTIHYLCLEPLRQGQAVYTHVNEIANGLKRLNYKVTIFSPSYSPNEILPGFLGRLISAFKVQLKLVFNEIKPDLIYIRWHPLSYLTAVWARLLKIPVIQEVNGPYADLFLAWKFMVYIKPIITYIFRKQLDWANHIITVTGGLKEFVQQESKNRNISIIENAANVNHFYPKKQTKIQLPEKFVLFFGTFSKWYDIATIIAATKTDVWPRHINLVFAGDGEFRPLVEKATESLYVTYLGRVPYEEIPGVVGKSLACLVPSLNAAGRANSGLSPLKMYESLACGVPVIVSDLPGQSEFVQDNGCGYIVQNSSPEDWAKAVGKMDSKYSEIQHKSHLAQNIIFREHSWEKRALDTGQIISRILKNKPRLQE